MGICYHDSDYVCTFPDGMVIASNYLTKTFHALIVKSDLPQIRLHDLRHSVASNLLSNGFSIVQVQEWLGHSSPEITLRFYAHVDKTSKDAIASAINKADAYADNNSFENFEGNSDQNNKTLDTINNESSAKKVKINAVTKKKLRKNAKFR